MFFIMEVYFLPDEYFIRWKIVYPLERIDSCCVFLCDRVKRIAFLHYMVVIGFGDIFRIRRES